ncbi:MAG: glycoside hydrolase family 2 TIM barrel-domain containing protein [Oscillospiraceae bacterium]|nr:glycoside hydrolase family 2 TIM barrel-domain containing protein [Oscillospiraceae bacterium]
MRTVIRLNDGWSFSKDGKHPQKVKLPHTWNAADGQDGGNDYYRGVCRYSRTIKKSELPACERVYLEVPAANSSADLSVNGSRAAHHDGGYSAWRADLTGALTDKTLIELDVDNSANDHVYPQMADFTFYGGLYRGINLICVPASHFALDDFGSSGLFVTPTITGKNANINLSVLLCGAKRGQTLRYTILDAEDKTVFDKIFPVEETAIDVSLENVRLWNGRRDPYLYTAKAQLMENGEELDCVQTRFGCRAYTIDPEKGFILNGEAYPLRGVARHQDWKGIGNALEREHHKRDIELICEMGATTVRLAHYQHSQDFYDMCDACGLIVWAEIPYISSHLPNGRENTVSQMTELVKQNYNHPSIVVWGLSNEITMGGDKDPDLLENHRVLNDLCHSLDKTRPTTLAVITMCDIHSPYVQISDVVSYNHYFGWYGGEVEMNGPWFDEFHKTFPKRPIGISEYGAEALNWHTSDPVQGDYTEEYQALYHEQMIRQIDARPYLWATHVWNMFDFGADARSEGGENGMNHKGLVTFDRKYKKDAFYAYKAWLSDEPFVHICGKRYTDRVEDVTKVTVYSNQPEVELFVNGRSLGRQSGRMFFYFDVPNVGKSGLLAVAGDCKDESALRKVKKFNEDYRLREAGALLNWFDVTAPEGYYSLNDKLKDIMKAPQGRALFESFFKKMTAGGAQKAAAGFQLNSSMMAMMGGFTVLRLTNMAGTAGVELTKEQLLSLNEQLNKIPRA